MAYYETVFIARQDASNQHVENLASTLEKLVQDNGGKVVHKEFWGLRSLAYRVKKNRKGHYVMLRLDAPSDVVNKLDHSLRYNEDVIRYLTVSVEEVDNKPSAMLKNAA